MGKGGNQSAAAATKRATSSLPRIGELRKALGPAVFQKSAVKSLAYLLFDFSVVAVLFVVAKFLERVVTSSIVGVPLWLAYVNVQGFFFWAIFVVGHDCGHKTFSDSALLNAVAGHLCHGLILVPFWPWAKSHKRHHQMHNHHTEDYSHPWLVSEEEIAKNKWLTGPGRFLLPTGLGWFMYLLGFGDGSHYLSKAMPGRLYAGEPATEHVKNVVSSLTCVLALGFWYAVACDSDLFMLCRLFLAPVVVFSWWLFTVTYLQHHSDGSIVYDDQTWNFVRGAFETIDRPNNTVIDVLGHHITDCHVVHHLFFTGIPHYNLPAATKALKEYLAKTGQSHLYQVKPTPNCLSTVYSLLKDLPFHASLVSRPQDSDACKKTD